jgi:chromosome segregation ATPase
MADSGSDESSTSSLARGIDELLRARSEWQALSCELGARGSGARASASRTEVVAGEAKSPPQPGDASALRALREELQRTAARLERERELYNAEVAEAARARPRLEPRVEQSVDALASALAEERGLRLQIQEQLALFQDRLRDFSRKFERYRRKTHSCSRSRSRGHGQRSRGNVEAPAERVPLEAQVAQLLAERGALEAEVQAMRDELRAALQRLAAAPPAAAEAKREGDAAPQPHPQPPPEVAPRVVPVLVPLPRGSSGERDFDFEGEQQAGVNGARSKIAVRGRLRLHSRRAGAKDAPSGDAVDADDEKHGPRPRAPAPHGESDEAQRPQRGEEPSSREAELRTALLYLADERDALAARVRELEMRAGTHPGSRVQRLESEVAQLREQLERVHTASQRRADNVSEWSRDLEQLTNKLAAKTRLLKQVRMEERREQHWSSARVAQLEEALQRARSDLAGARTALEERTRELAECRLQNRQLEAALRREAGAGAPKRRGAAASAAAGASGNE